MEFKCENCGHKRNDTVYTVTSADLEAGVAVINEKYEIKLALKSLYNIYNILAAFTVASLVGIDGTIRNWGVMLTRIREKNPDIEIYIQSGTPIYIGGEKGGLNNQNMDRYNERLKVFAEENNCHYIDIATVMKNERGGLKAEFSLDNYVHVNYTACDAWALVLKEYVGE